MILAGDPDRWSMWFTEYYKAKLNDSNWTVLSPKYNDIIEWMLQLLIDEIFDLKKNNPISYRQIYLGDLEVTGWEKVFHSFMSKHSMARNQLIKLERELIGYQAIIHFIIIGIDDAITISYVTVHENGILRV